MPITNVTNLVTVILHYIHEEETVKSVSSVLNFSNSFVVIVDNSQNFNVTEFTTNDRVKILKTNKNLGFAGGVNYGINWAMLNLSYEFIFLLNNDALVTKHCIDELLSAIELDSKILISAPKIVFSNDEEKIWYGGGDISFYSLNAKVRLYKKPVSTLKPYELQYIKFATGCAMMFKKEFFEKYGLFEDKYFMYEEDLEICLRLIKLPQSIIFNPKATVIHCVQGSQSVNSPLKLPRLHPQNNNLSFYSYYIFRNTLLNIKKHGSFKKPLYYLLNAIKFYLKCIQWLCYGRIDAISSGLRGIKDFLLEKK